MKKILIGLIACMFLLSMLPGIFGEEATEYTIKERKYKDDRKIIPFYTARGLEKAPNARGKPGAYVTITDPDDGETVSGTEVVINVDSNYKGDYCYS